MSIIATILCGILVTIIYLARYKPIEEFSLNDKVKYRLSDDISDKEYTGVITAKLTYIKESIINDTTSKVVRRQTNDGIEKNVIVLYEVRPDSEGDTFLLSEKRLTKITEKEQKNISLKNNIEEISNNSTKYEDKRKYKKGK
jgi:hypothetical protein